MRSDNNHCHSRSNLRHFYKDLVDIGFDLRRKVNYSNFKTVTHIIDNRADLSEIGPLSCNHPHYVNRKKNNRKRNFITKYMNLLIELTFHFEVFDQH